MPLEDSQKIVQRDKNGRLLPGSVLNPEGKKLGTLNFATEWKDFIKKVAADNGLTPKEIDEQLYKVAWQKAKEGDYQFYKDIQDRVYGKAQQSLEVQVSEKKLLLD